MIQKLSLEEQEERLNSIKQGSWHEKSERARKFINPNSKLVKVAVTGKTIELTKLPMTASDKTKETSLRTILRDHRRKPITDAKEIEIRDSLDSAMTYFQLMELGLRSNYIELTPKLKLELRSELLIFVWSKSVRQFLRAYGYFSIGRLSTLVGLEHEHPILNLPETNGYSVGYAGFFATVKELEEDKSIERWLALMDDYVFDQKDTRTSVRKFLTELASGKSNNTLDSAAAFALTGLERFVALMSSLFQYADESDRLAYGLFFYYWLAKCAGRDQTGLVKISENWLQLFENALSKLLKKTDAKVFSERITLLKEVHLLCENSLLKAVQEHKGPGKGKASSTKSGGSTQTRVVITGKKVAAVSKPTKNVKSKKSQSRSVASKKPPKAASTRSRAR